MNVQKNGEASSIKKEINPKDTMIKILIMVANKHEIITPIIPTMSITGKECKNRKPKTIPNIVIKMNFKVVIPK